MSWFNNVNKRAKEKAKAEKAKATKKKAQKAKATKKKSEKAKATKKKAQKAKPKPPPTPPPPPESEEDEDPYEEWSKRELLELATEYGIVGRYGMSKDELVDALYDYDEQE